MWTGVWLNVSRSGGSSLLTQTISIRLPEALLEDLERLATKRDVPHQSLLKIFLAERVAQELRSHS
jgi:CopG antitoxin of type II toxin-antitoxin system